MRNSFRKFWNWYISLGNRGGGEEARTEIIQPPAPPPLERTPAQIQAETAAAMRGAAGTARELYPEQYALYEAFIPQLMQQLQAPTFRTPEEEEAQEAIRGRETERLQRGIRTAYGLGGGLYGGRRELAERRGLTELGQAFAQQDIGQRLSRQQMLYGAISPYAQQVPQMGQMGVVSPESIYQQYVGRMMAQQPEVFYTPEQPSPAWELGGQALGAAGSVAAAKMFVGCLAEDTVIITKKKIKDIQAGEQVLTNVGFKEVKKTFSSDKPPTIEVNGLQCTEFHPIVTPEGLKLSGQFKEKKSIQSNKKVYNLEVEGHKYYANDVLVHDGREVK